MNRWSKWGPVVFERTGCSKLILVRINILCKAKVKMGHAVSPNRDFINRIFDDWLLVKLIRGIKTKSDVREPASGAPSGGATVDWGGGA